MPNVVCASTVHSTSAATASATGSPLIAAALNTSQAAPDAIASASPLQAMAASGVRSDLKTRASAAAPRTAGSNTRTTKNTTPVAAMVAAK